MKLSIVVPVYNTANYLSRCIDSILNQNYKDFELLLIDDGSTDGSADICDEYARVDIRIHVIHKENGGSASTRIAGIKASKGGYIGFVDSDDWIEPYMYEKLMKAFEDQHSVDVSIGGYVVDELDGHTSYPLKRTVSKKYTSWEALEEMFLGKTFLYSLCDKVYKKNLIDDMYILDQCPNSYGEDTFVNAHVFTKAATIFFQPVYGYHYCMNKDSMTHQMFSKKNLAYFSIWNDLIKEYRLEHYTVAYNIWKIMQSYSICALSEMHKRYTEFQDELSHLQQILEENLNFFGIQGDQKVQYQLSVLMKCHEKFILWEKDKVARINSFIKQYGKEGCYIYGAGEYAERLTNFFRKYSVPFDGYVVSSLHQGKKVVSGKKIIEFSDTDGQKCCFLLALSKKNEAEVIPCLKQCERKYFSVQDFISIIS